ncbi:hypothetical protein AB0L40_09265 [Patulibacter sp. NPDC049589]|uniref:hypothetical protein n=1 Tax=Patulibacter sp. NPDC049589 TaxID=3154731 RepID=UPI003429DA6F
MTTDAPGAQAVVIPTPDEIEALNFAGVRSLMIGRTALEAPLVDVPGKMIHGSYAMAHVLPDIARTIEDRMPAEELGRRLKQTSVQMSVGLGGLLFTYVLGRLQRHLDAGWPDGGRVDDDEGAAFLYTWWARAMSTYREDDVLLPTADSPGWPILAPDAVKVLADQALARGPIQDVDGARRAIAQLEAFVFMLHADARDGINHHGPYDLGDGRVLLVKEHTDIQNPYLPWGPEHHAPVSRIAIALVLENVQIEVDLVGGLSASPQNYLANCVGFDVLVDDDLHSVSEEEWHEIAASTGPLNRSLLKRFMGWDARQRADHGAAQYGNVTRGWMETAGFTQDEVKKIAIEPFVAAGDRYIDRIAAGDHPPIFAFVVSDDPKLVPIRASA